MTGTEVFWLIIAPAYAFVWMLASAFFTHHWRTDVGCAPGCTYKRAHYINEPDTGSHAALCGKWRDVPQTPADAMGLAVVWPLTGFNYILAKSKSPSFKKPPKHKGPGLPESVLKELDNELYNDKDVA